MEKRYKKVIEKGIGDILSEKGLFQEHSEEINLSGESAERLERNTYGILSCGCTVTDPKQIKVCSVCGRTVCEKHSTECQGSIVCLRCCPAGGNPDPITCFSCSVRRFLRRIL